MTRYDEYIARKKQQYPNFDASELSKQFIPYFNSGERIEVEIYGEKIRGTVGVTTGWKPVFLLMRRSNSTGSSDILRDDAKIVKVISK